MTGIHRTSRTTGDPMTALEFHGKEEVVGSNPTEGFGESPANSAVFALLGPGARPLMEA